MGSEMCIRDSLIVIMQGAAVKWFDRQKPALAHREKMDEIDCGIFVLQKSDGRRRFCAAPYTDFVDKYLKLDYEMCHFYEVVCEDSPCRLYFDVEYDKKLNPGRFGLILTAMFINYVIHCLKVFYKVHCNYEDVLQLESSTEHKFSHHLVFHIPNILFLNNVHCGYFVRAIAAAARDAVEGKGLNKFTENYSIWDLEDLFLEDTKSERVFITDLAVYSRNQQFRLWKSSKVGKDVPLTISQNNKFTVHDDEKLFFDSLITATSAQEYGKRIISYYDPTVVNISGEKVCSELPGLDRYVLQKIRSQEMHKYCTISHIRQSELNNKSARLYSLRGSRWCNNVKREHEENRIYYCVNMEMGVMYQMCNAESCKGYRSTALHVPQNLYRK